jgi:hypothetical protein
MDLPKALKLENIMRKKVLPAYFSGQRQEMSTGNYLLRLE